MTVPQVSVSIVSHGHGPMVGALVRQVLNCASVGQVIVTCNIAEEIVLPKDSRVSCAVNLVPKGFGANHNAAFARASHTWFAILNPDVVLISDPFEPLVGAAERAGSGIVAPMALNAAGFSEDNWRQFPSIGTLLRKALGGWDGSYRMTTDLSGPFAVDWVSGLCMLVRRDAYTVLGGFDERYFMYYEDVDLCARAWRKGISVFACPDAQLIHNAQRASRRNFQHMRWHLESMFRYLVNYSFRLPRANGA